MNAHFDRLKAADPPHSPGLLVVDELGQLELLRGGGLTSAMDVLSQGPSARALTPSWWCGRGCSKLLPNGSAMFGAVRRCSLPTARLVRPCVRHSILFEQTIPSIIKIDDRY